MRWTTRGGSVPRPPLIFFFLVVGGRVDVVVVGTTGRAKAREEVVSMEPQCSLGLGGRKQTEAKRGEREKKKEKAGRA